MLKQFDLDNLSQSQHPNLVWCRPAPLLQLVNTVQRHSTKFAGSRRLAKELGPPGPPEGVFEGISLVLPCEHMWSLTSCDFKTMSVHLQWSAFSTKFFTEPQHFRKLPLEAAYNHPVFSEFYKSSAYMNDPLGEFETAHSKLVLNLKEEWMRNHALESPSPFRLWCVH